MLDYISLVEKKPSKEPMIEKENRISSICSMCDKWSFVSECVFVCVCEQYYMQPELEWAALPRLHANVRVAVAIIHFSAPLCLKQFASWCALLAKCCRLIRVLAHHIARYLLTMENVSIQRISTGVDSTEMYVSFHYKQTFIRTHTHTLYSSIICGITAAAVAAAAVDSPYEHEPYMLRTS